MKGEVEQIQRSFTSIFLVTGEKVVAHGEKGHTLCKARPIQ